MNMKNTRIISSIIIGLLTLVVGCSSIAQSPTETHPPATLTIRAPVQVIPTVGALEVPTETPPPTTIAQAHGWTDENALMSGLCFEAVNDAAETAFVFRREAELRNLYDLADNSRLCRELVGRGTFDFSNERVLAGIWSRANGCTAHHQVINVRRDDVAMIYVVRLRLVTQGNCAYELVRPFWVGLDGVSDYDVRIVVVNG